MLYVKSANNTSRVSGRGCSAWLDRCLLNINHVTMHTINYDWKF